MRDEVNSRMSIVGSGGKERVSIVQFAQLLNAVENFTNKIFSLQVKGKL